MSGEGQAEVRRVDRAEAISAHRFRYYDFAMAASCVIVVASNIIGAGKVANVAGFDFGAGVLFFPLAYVLGDVLTEVYGYARARRVVWASFAAAGFAAFMATAVTAMPPAPGWNEIEGAPFTRQEAFVLNFGQAPRIVFASVLALWAGEMANAYVLARLKIFTDGKRLWQRTIGSTVVGQGIDSLIFYPLAFLFVWPLELVLTVMATNYALKVLWEALLTPVTYRIVGFLKRAEGVDVYDRGTDFTPFSVRT
jgi:hypothetical protein